MENNNNAPDIHQQERDFIRRLGVRTQQAFRTMWSRRASVLIRLFEYTLIFLVVKRVSWACDSDEDIDTTLMVLGIVASSYSRQPRGWRVNGRVAACNLLKGCVWPSIYMLTLWIGLTIYLDDEA